MRRLFAPADTDFDAESPLVLPESPGPEADGLDAETPGSSRGSEPETVFSHAGLISRLGSLLVDPDDDGEAFDVSRSPTSTLDLREKKPTAAGLLIGRSKTWGQRLGSGESNEAPTAGSWLSELLGSCLAETHGVPPRRPQTGATDEEDGLAETWGCALAQTTLAESWGAAFAESCCAIHAESQSVLAETWGESSPISVLRTSGTDEAFGRESARYSDSNHGVTDSGKPRLSSLSRGVWRASGHFTEKDGGARECAISSPCSSPGGVTCLIFPSVEHWILFTSAP